MILKMFTAIQRKRDEHREGFNKETKIYERAKTSHRAEEYNN